MKDAAKAYLTGLFRKSAPSILSIQDIEQIEGLVFIRKEHHNQRLILLYRHIQIALSRVYGLMVLIGRLLFYLASSFNNAFRLDKKSTKKQTESNDRLIELLTHYDIDPKRVVYMGMNTNHSKHMVAESSDLLKLFFSKYKIRKNCVIFSDNGNAFFEEGESALIKVGFDIHRTYPAPVHFYLSPNDSHLHLHGSAKASWRQSGVDFKDDVSSSLMLLNHLDVEISTNSKMWFSRNIIHLEEDSVIELIGKSNIEKSEYRMECKELFQKFVSNNNNNI